MIPKLDWGGRWRRFSCWEYWPTWALYGPALLPLVLRYGLRGRLLDFTAVNPAIRGSGVVNESKLEILEQLQRANPDFTTPTLAWNPASAPSSSQVGEWMTQHQIGYPLVLKPDAAQRGLGVLFAENETHLKALASHLNVPYLLQPAWPGQEYSLFFIRPPQDKGFIFSMTRKIPPEVVGDGVLNIVELVRRHPRHRAVVHLLPQCRGDEGSRVPASGESVKLSSIGAHCRGSTFMDGRDLITPELTASIESVFEKLPGWTFGRFDLFCSSEEDLKSGRNFHFIELNGVTSEATHIYDPKHSVLEAWRTLRQQWRWAFKIGGQQKEMGHPTLSITELLQDHRTFQHKAEQIQP